MRAQGIGGVFLYAVDPVALAAWYAKHFDLALAQWGDTWGMELPSADREPSDRRASTTFAIFPSKEALSGKRVTVNWRVDDIAAAVADLTAAGCTFPAVTEDDAYGKFARTTDPEGNGIELWQPPASADWPED